MILQNHPRALTEQNSQNNSISYHAFSDSAHLSPPVFVFLLKEFFLQGNGSVSCKCRVVMRHIALKNIAQPVFTIHCLYLFPIFGSSYNDTFTGLMLSSFRHLQSKQQIHSDFPEVKVLAAQLVVDALSGVLSHRQQNLFKVLENFDVGFEDILKAIGGPENADEKKANASMYVEQLAFGLLEAHAHMPAVVLLERFPIRHIGESVLCRLLQASDLKSAERLACFLGKPVICLLVQKYLDMDKFKAAMILVRDNNLDHEFPNAYHLYKKSLLKKLSHKECWEIAEAKANGDRQLIEYLVLLAINAGYIEKAEELCKHYSLTDLQKFVVQAELFIPKVRYLRCSELGVEDIVWVDDIHGLRGAFSHVYDCEAIGLDCEWNPNQIKGFRSSQVAIMQIASTKHVFILDMIKLFSEQPDVLKSGLKRLFQSSAVIKLGYNFKCDILELSASYDMVDCFKDHKMLIDVAKVFEEPGGLSGLAEKLLGAAIDKRRRNSNWERRPLSQNQMEYAALDAAVLVHVFYRVGENRFNKHRYHQL